MTAGSSTQDIIYAPNLKQSHTATVLKFEPRKPRYTVTSHNDIAALQQQCQDQLREVRENRSWLPTRLRQLLYKY